MNFKIIKFGTQHCPQCKLQDRELMKVTSIPVEIVDAEDREDLVEKYAIESVPTTVVVNSDTEEKHTVFVGLTKGEEIQKIVDLLIKESSYETD